ncbi:nicotinamide riboside transporter PnuC, partial [Pseudomonas sp. MDMC224]
MTNVFNQFIDGLQQTGALEFIAVFAGIASVWFSRKENILVYPVGLINTSIYVYLSVKGHLLGEASVNFYYTVMSIYGWMLWARKDQQNKETLLHITYSSARNRIEQLLFFVVFYVAIFGALTW